MLKDFLRGDGLVPGYPKISRAFGRIRTWAGGKSGLEIALEYLNVINDLSEKRSRYLRIQAY